MDDKEEQKRKRKRGDSRDQIDAKRSKNFNGESDSVTDIEVESNEESSSGEMPTLKQDKKDKIPTKVMKDVPKKQMEFADFEK